MSSSCFTWAVLDISQKQYTALELYDLPKKDNEAQKLILDLLNNHLWLSRLHSSQSIAYVNTFNTLVPSAVYQDKDKETYFTTGVSEATLNIQTQGINNIGVQCVYGVSQGHSSLIKKKFPAIKEFHHTGTLLNALTNENLLTQETSVLINIHDELFDIVVMRDKQLLLLNTYTYRTKEDFLFFLLNTCEQLKLDLEQTTFTINGRVERTSQIVEITEKYIPKVQFGKRPGKFRYSYIFNELPEHYFFNLFSQYLCV